MCTGVSPGSVDIEAVDVEREQGHHVREQRKGKGQAEAGWQTPVPENPLNEWRHQVDVAWKQSLYLNRKQVWIFMKLVLWRSQWVLFMSDINREKNSTVKR